MSKTSHVLPICEIFDSLSPTQRDEVMKLMERHVFEPGQTILEEGKQSRGLWVITQGRCEVVKLARDGTGRTLAELGPGSVFGEMSFIQIAPHSATVQSVTDVQTLVLTQENYARLEESGLRSAHSISHAITIILAERLRRMDEWTTRLLDEAPTDKHEEWSDFRAKLYNNLGF